VIPAWRIVSDTYAGSAFSGEGARLAGARWNYPGTAVVYLGGSPAITALEQFVHTGLDGRHIPLFIIKVEIPKNLKMTRISALPRDWRSHPPSESTKDIGREWFIRGDTAILQVPSAVIPAETVYVVNPLHRDFHSLRICRPEPFVFDDRMWKMPPVPPA